MDCRIETLAEKKMIGHRRVMSFANNETRQLWQGFMPHRKEIGNAIGTELYSVQVYDAAFSFERFDPIREFEKWAVVEVTDFESVPEGMEALTIPGGLYAVFHHVGPASAGPRTFQYIFGTWLPGSDYVLDTRPHFEVLGEKYKNEDPASEEDIWIPIRQKTP